MFRGAVGKFARSVSGIRRFGHGHHHTVKPGHVDLHVSQVHKTAGTFLQVVMWLWIFYAAKENKGQILNLYHPWLHPHEHHDAEVSFSMEGDKIIITEVEGHGHGDHHEH